MGTVEPPSSRGRYNGTPVLLGLRGDGKWMLRRDLNGMEGHGKGQKRGPSGWDRMKGQNRKE